VDLLALGYVPHTLAEATEVSQLRVPSGGRVADLCSVDAADFGVTREISTTGRYDITQVWAHRLGIEVTGHPMFSALSSAMLSPPPPIGH